MLAYRELNDVLGLTLVVGDELVDPRTGKNGQHAMKGLFRQSVFGRLGGYENVNYADRLGRDPAMRWIVGGRAVAKAAASTSQMGRFETEFLATDENLTVLAGLSGQWIDRVHARQPPRMIVLDMDYSVSPTHGDQEGTAYNGHFGCSCYHPLFVFNQFGDLERCVLRPGNVHSAHGWHDVLEPVVARYRDWKVRRYFRGDAAFASPDLYEFLEAEDYKYAIRLRANTVLQASIAHLLTRPVGRPPNHVRCFYASFSYQAASWNARGRRRYVRRRVRGLCIDCAAPSQGAARCPECARRSYLRSHEHRGLPILPPRYTVIEIATGTDHGTWYSMAEVAMCLAYARLSREDVEVISDVSPMAVLIGY